MICIYVYKCTKVIKKYIAWWFSYINIIYDCIYIICNKKQWQQEFSYVSKKIGKIPLTRWNHSNYPVIAIYASRCAPCKQPVKYRPVQVILLKSPKLFQKAMLRRLLCSITHPYTIHYSERYSLQSGRIRDNLTKVIYKYLTVTSQDNMKYLSPKWEMHFHFILGIEVMILQGRFSLGGEYVWGFI